MTVSLSTRRLNYAKRFHKAVAKNPEFEEDISKLRLEMAEEAFDAPEFLRSASDIVYVFSEPHMKMEDRHEEYASYEPSDSTSDQELKIRDELPEGFLTPPRFSLVESDDIVEVNHCVSATPKSNPIAQNSPTMSSILYLDPETKHVGDTTFKIACNIQSLMHDFSTELLNKQEEIDKLRREKEKWIQALKRRIHDLESTVNKYRKAIQMMNDLAPK